MSIFKRGRTYWFHFLYDGQHVQRSTKQGNPRTARQIEAARVTIARFLKKRGKLWIRIFPDKAITKHPAETRMGKGKGAPDHWVSVVKPGRVMFELEGLTLAEAKEAMRLAAAKLPIRTNFVVRY